VDFPALTGPSTAMEISSRDVFPMPQRAMFWVRSQPARMAFWWDTA
jgi:hypothetical protein